jgi:DNA-binding transcriptional LysR family regulator
MRHAWTPTLAELEAFVATAHDSTTTAAAAALGLSQSAVSRAVATLEERLGLPLFHRIRKRLTLTEAGRAFLPQAERLLSDLDRSARDVMGFGGAPVLRIACLPTFAQLWLIPRLAGFMRRTGVTVDLSTTLAPVDFARDLRDAAVLRGPVEGPSLTLAPDRLIVVAAPGIGADLDRLPLLQQATRPDLWPAFRDGTPARGPRFETFGMVLAAARAGIGAALVPEVLVAPDLAAGTLVRLSPQSLDGGAPYLLTWPDRSDDLPAFRAFRAALDPGAGTPQSPQP